MTASKSSFSRISFFWNVNFFARMSDTQEREMFQSSWTSWSSKIIEVETVERSQRITGSDQASL